jgi:hypothetical protein
MRLRTRISIVSALALSSAFAQNWPERIRPLAAAGKLDEALKTVEQWMAAEPSDFEALTWHARITGWRGRAHEAEQEFRILLKDEPDNPELLFGLAAALNARGQHDKALAALDRACPGPSGDPDCRLARARTLALAGKAEEARQTYAALAGVDAVAAQSKRELEALREESRYRVRIETGREMASFTSDTMVLSATLSTRLTPRLESEVELTQKRRGSDSATGGVAQLALRLGRHDSFNFGGGWNGVQEVAPRASALVGYDHGFVISRHGAVRTVEAIYDQRWTWFPGVRVASMAPAALVYLPRDWDLLLQSTLTGVALEREPRSWNLSGRARLAFPISRRFRANVMAGTGSENFGSPEQLLFRASRSAGGGVSIRAGAGWEFHLEMRYQSIAGGRSLASCEGGYAFRF